MNDIRAAELAIESRKKTYSRDVLENGNRKIYWWERLLAIAITIGFLIAIAYFTIDCFG